MLPEPRPKKSWRWLWLPLLMIILGGVTAFAWQTYQLKQEIGQIKTSASPSPIIASPQPSAIVSPTPDPTASWPIYTNKLHEYFLKHPVDWQVNSQTAEVNINSKLVLSKNNYQIVIYANLEGFGGTRSQVPATPIMVSGLDLFKREIGDNHYSQTGSWEISASDSSPTFKYKDKTYEIYLTYPLPEKNSVEYKAVLNTFDQILSTFKFTDSQSLEPQLQKRFGYIKAITVNYDNYLISFDPAEMVGQQVNNPDFQIVELQTDVPGSEPKVIMQTYSRGADGNFNANQEISFSEFLDAFEKQPEIKNVPYWVETYVTTVTKISEQYLP